MAPALNEPMSPTEKLSNSTRKVTPATRSVKNTNEETISTTPTLLITSPNSICINNETKEKRSRTPSVSTPTPSSSTVSTSTPSSSALNSTRVTRSKDAYQRVFEQAVSPTPIISQQLAGKHSTITTKSCLETAKCLSDSDNAAKTEKNKKNVAISEEPMAMNNKKINIDTDKNIVETFFSDAVAVEGLESESNCNNNNNTNISCKSNSTEQLLADLTNDIEETITTKVCIRKHLQDVTVGKNGSNVLNVLTNTKTEIKDVDIIKSDVKDAKDTNTNISPTISESSHKVDLRHVDVGTHSVNSDKNENCFESTSKALAQKQPISVERKRLNNDNTSGEVPAKVCATVPPDMHGEQKTGCASSLKTDVSTRLQILSVDVLPPISTDSTMTASEVEDNLEERLSQLDGTAMASPIRESVNPETANMETIPTTPPRTPIKQQTHQQEVQQLQQQLQQTPPTTLSQQAHQQHHIIQQQNTFTPQSSTSSVNTINSSNLPPAFMKESGAGELEDQDIEEVLKVLKGFDGSAGADTLCDLNVLFNEEYTLNYEEVSSHIASTSNKPNPLKEMQNELERNQQGMYRKIDFLLRRLRKIQSRYMSKHCSEEIAGLFEWTARMFAGKGGAMNRSTDVLCTDTAISVIAARPPASNWSEEKNPVASTQMSSMLRRLEQSSNAQQLCMVPTNRILSASSSHMPRKSKKAFLHEVHTAASASAAGSSATMVVERKGEIVVPTYDINVSEEMAQVAGLLQTEMREVQTAMDSDATESSSGGESADEMVTYNNQIQQPLAIAKRAAWRYSRDRAAIAARWSWLLSQIADLEIKIRQHTELRQEIIRTKGSVVCSSEEQSATENADGLKSNEISATNISTSSVNGYKGNLNSKVNVSEDVELGPLGAARTRGFVQLLFRKRKLLQTQSLHTISKKAARPSNIKCGCQWPFNPCALCTGRLDPTAPRDPPDTMMFADRIALIDPGYHPVLSFREDVSSTLHFEAIARMPDWQQRVMRCQVKSIAKSVWKAEREAERAAGHNTSKKYNEPVVKRRYTKKKDRLAAEEKNAAAAAATSTTTNSANASLSPAIGLASDSSANLTKGVGKGVENVGASANVSYHSVSETSASLPASDGGNESVKKSKKLHHYHLVGDGVLLEPPRPLSPIATNHSSHSQSSHHSQQSGNSNSNCIHQTSDNPPQNYDQFSPSPIHSSLISNNSNGLNGGGSGGGVGVGGSSGIGNHKHNNKNRKSSASSISTGIANNTSHHHQSSYSTTNYTNYNGDTNDGNWDSFIARSRTSSPTHTSGSAVNSSYYKYERSKNRTSYDIDNIVIPYSVAATTRVEILPYKEIPTPKWRVIEEDQKLALCTSTSEMESDKLGNAESSDNKVKNDTCEIGNKPQCDISAEKAEETHNAREREEKEVTVEGNTTNKKPIQGSENVDVIVASQPNAKQNNVAKSVSSDVELSNASGLNSNNILDNTNINAIIKPDDKMTTVNELSTVNALSDEPAVKKSKHESAGESKSSIVNSNVFKNVEVAEAANENDSTTSNATKITKGETMLALKRATRLKRSNTIQEESVNVDATADETSETEDISNETVMLRHERALAEERRKFKTYLKYPWSTRSRANRRIDSRAESSGANTPDPCSPAPPTLSLGGTDQESIPSPSALSTPLHPLDAITEATENGTSNPANAIGGVSSHTNNNDMNKRLERRRTTSMKKDRELERRSSTPDPKELVPPYEPLKFPLTDEEFEGLLKAMPVEFHYLDFDAKYLEDCNNIGASAGGSKFSRQRSNWRGDIPVLANRRGKLTSTTQNCDATNNKRQRVNNNGRIRKGSKGGRGRRRGNLTRVPVNESTNGVNGADEVEDEEVEDDDVDLMMLLAEEDDDYDYPKHHLAPDDDLFDGGSSSVAGIGVGGTLNGSARDRMFNIDDEYEAYLGRRHRETDVDTTDSEPFGDDDPNDPEWRGEGEDRGGGGSNERHRRTAR
ncbi:uncharacterized protein LOC101460170 isoform X2 [Ceratitis capitata]|uniref:uncharacterized protein LOC101460170 isoform X2 n=1 Tax=Ceratitis capitata TaxID=7213 RepID=UPI00061880C6|nr:uncharacterized protein LOC101460170 isoform X2 [Ceratitis capitata]